MAGFSKASARRERPRVVGITRGAAFALVATVVAAFVLRDAFVAAHRTAGWLVACAIVALLIDPVVAIGQRHLPRWLSIVAVSVGVAALFGLVTVGLVGELLDSTAELERAAPEAALGLEERYEWAGDVGVADRVQTLMADLHRSIREVTVDRAVGTVPTYLVTGILMLFLLAYGRRYLAAFFDQFDDRDRADRWRAVMVTSVVRGRAYVLTVLAHSALNAVAFGIVCWALDLAAPFSLGVAVGALTVVPLMGVLIGSVPALLLAFGAHSFGVGVTVAIVVVLLQAIEVSVVRRVVDVRTVRVGPTVPVVVGLLAFELYGVGGAVYAIASAVFGLATLDAVGLARGDDVVSQRSTQQELQRANESHVAGPEPA